MFKQKFRPQSLNRSLLFGVSSRQKILRKQLVTGALGAIIGGGISIYSTHLAVQAQEDLLKVQIEASRADMQNQIIASELEMKRERRVEIFAEIIMLYGNMAGTWTHYQYKDRDRWEQIKNYTVVMQMMDLAEVGQALEYLYDHCRPAQFNNTKSYAPAHTECMDKLVGAMKKATN